MLNPGKQNVTGLAMLCSAHRASMCLIWLAIGLILVTTVAEVGYEQLFRPDGDGQYVHDFGGGLRWFSGLEGTDVEATARGEVSISPVTPLVAGKFPTAFVDGLGGASGKEQRP